WQPNRNRNCLTMYKTITLQRDLACLADEQFDILIIGGGISGAFIAWDAALRGFKTALVEKGDFGAATSSASSKLLHGGIRYLQQAHFNKVRESALERAHFQYMAPHLSHYIPFLVPTYKSLMKSKFVLSYAMRFYELLSWGEKRIISDAAKFPPPIRRLNREQTLAIAPYIDRPDLTGAVCLPESHMRSSERMTLSIIKTAVSAGAKLANYVQAIRYLQQNNRVSGCRVKDVLTGDEFTIRAKLTINASGPWIPLLDQSLTGKSATTGYARGSHVVVSNIQPDHAVALATNHGSDAVINRGGRHVFIIPWRGRALIGTSYASYRDPLDSIHVTEADILQILNSINDAAPQLQMQRNHIDYAFCGLYPLQASDIKPGIYQGTGEYQLFDHKKDRNLDGLISVLGAKYTTARRLGEYAVNLASHKLKAGQTKSKTTGQRVIDGNIDDLEEVRKSLLKQVNEIDLANHLLQSYGTSAFEITKNNNIDNVRLSNNQPVTKTEVNYILDNEMAMTLDDVIFRRTGLGTVGHPGMDCIVEIASLMAAKHGWDDRRKNTEISRVNKRWNY
ncbi:MAG: glycerol-3-phosphate dehydrogenase/oxidase, partial [Cyanobacteria bacterium P01_E01_bin.35]